MKQGFYFERDGSYNEYEPSRKKPGIDDSFRLHFDAPIALQVANRMREEHQQEIARCVEAYRTLLEAGCLPGNRCFQMQKQINMKADRYVRKFKKTIRP